jgi:hypothetical protein
MGRSKGGFRKLTLHNDGSYQLTDNHFKTADTRLGQLGFRRTEIGLDWVQWEKL